MFGDSQTPCDFRVKMLLVLVLVLVLGIGCTVHGSESDLFLMGYTNVEVSVVSQVQVGLFIVSGPVGPLRPLQLWEATKTTESLFQPAGPEG